MKQIFTNARLILPAEEQPKEGSLVVDGDRITLAGDISENEPYEKIDCKGRILAPESLTSAFLRSTNRPFTSAELQGPH